MRAFVLLIAVAACTPRPFAETFVKKNFGFTGDREITLAGPGEDTHMLRLELEQRGFKVYERHSLDDAPTRYVATVGGVCNSPLVVAPDAELHVWVSEPDKTMADGRARVLSVRLDNNDDCPRAFFAEAAYSIARHWPRPKPP